MKNFLFGLIGSVLGIIIGYLTWHQNPQKNPNGEITYTQETEKSTSFSLVNNITLDSQTIRKLSRNFIEQSEGDDASQDNFDHKYSKFVTFPKDIFISMGKYFSDSSTKNMYGVRCYFIQYDYRYTKNNNDPMLRIPGKKYRDQTSIVFVPVNSLKKPVYNVWNKKDGGGFNHGEVCPDSCSAEY
jgi:hypothetical protein